VRLGKQQIAPLDRLKWYFFVYVASSMLHKKIPLQAANEQGVTAISKQQYTDANRHTYVLYFIA